jgi:hypothetical protein
MPGQSGLRETSRREVVQPAALRLHRAGAGVKAAAGDVVLKIAEKAPSDPARLARSMDRRCMAFPIVSD